MRLTIYGHGLPGERWSVQEPIGSAGIPKEAESKALTLLEQSRAGAEARRSCRGEKGQGCGRGFMVGGESS